MKVYVQKRNIILMAYLECRRDSTAPHNVEEEIPEGGLPFFDLLQFYYC